jgi:hypothetical protein
MSRILSIVDTAYRGTLEEQDDTILWLNHAIKNAGADVTILLKGNAVNYAVKGQDAAGLTFGGTPQSNPPAIDRDLQAMIQKGIFVMALQEDLRDLGLSSSDLIGGIEIVGRTNLPSIFDQFDQIWHW